MYLQTPLQPADLRKLKLGSIVYLSGKIYTARDQVHKYLAEGHPPPVDLKGQAIYHSGPIAVRKDGKWEFWSFGPTTSIRQEPYTEYLIKKLGVKVIIGKGGMGDKTAAACRDYGAVYLHTIGGGGVVLANCVKEIYGVHLKQFGLPEALWEVRVEYFPAIVTIDAHGQSLHTEILANSLKIATPWIKQKEPQNSQPSKL